MQDMVEKIPKARTAKSGGFEAKGMSRVLYLWINDNINIKILEYAVIKVVHKSSKRVKVRSRLLLMMLNRQTDN